MYRIRIVALLIVSLILIVTSVACGESDKKDTTVKQFNESSAGAIKAKAHPFSNKKISEKIAQDLVKIKELEKATVIVHEQDVIIGMDVKKGKDFAKVGHRVMDKVKQAKPDYNIHVTADKALCERIEMMHTTMNRVGTPGSLRTDSSGLFSLDGKPIRSMKEDIDLLIQDIGRKAKQK